MQAPLKYPIGIQTFEDIIKGGYLYADKTGDVYRLVSSGAKHVFLSRPRRFGKSLLLSTLESYFEGRKDLFEGLELGRLETEWKSYPVLRFSFGSIEPEDESKINSYVNAMLKQYEVRYGVDVNESQESFGARFGLLISNIAEKTGKKVVVLIDEYDKGIVDILHDEEKLERNIALFRPFYAQLKDQDKYLHFAFLTGVSRFRNLTLFSAPNQLKDISMDERYATICGITPEELDSVFAAGIKNVATCEKISEDEARYQLKIKYDGYRFTSADAYVYNPFSILNCLDEGKLKYFWLTSGGASKVFTAYLKNSNYDLSKIEEKSVTEATLGGPYSLKDPIPLLFQTGYLTIADYEFGMYRLCIPNGEVRSALVDELAPLYLNADSDDIMWLVGKLGRFANGGDAEGMMVQFQQIISKISHQEFKLNDVEHIYHIIMSIICQMAGVNAHSEVSVAGGDIDMLIETRHYVYVFEFKKDHSAEEALKQIESKGYALPWKADGRKVFKIGVEFSSKTRNISSWIIQ